MAMVIAEKGSHIIKVSQASFDKMFKNKGYRIVKKEQKETEIVKESKNEKQMEETHETEHEEIETIPISEMNKEQLMEFAEKHNIDTSGARNVREARQIIQKSMRESKM